MEASSCIISRAIRYGLVAGHVQEDNGECFQRHPLSAPLCEHPALTLVRNVVACHRNSSYECRGCGRRVYGMFSITGGLIGYLKAKRVASLMAGSVSGALLLFFAYGISHGS